MNFRVALLSTIEKFGKDMYGKLWGNLSLGNCFPKDVAKEKYRAAKILGECVDCFSLFEAIPEVKIHSRALEDNPDPETRQAMHQDFKAWKKLCQTRLSQFTDAHLFPSNLTGYYICATDAGLRAIFLMPFLSKDIDDTPSQYCQYPKNWRRLEDMHQEVNRWAQELGDAEGETKKKNQLLIQFCHEAAKHAAELLKESEIFSPENPFVQQMVEMCFDLLQHMCVQYHVEDRVERGKFVYTNFVEQARQNYSGGDLRSIEKVILDLQHLGGDISEKGAEICAKLAAGANLIINSRDIDEERRREMIRWLEALTMSRSALHKDATLPVLTKTVFLAFCDEVCDKVSFEEAFRAELVKNNPHDIKLHVSARNCSKDSEHQRYADEIGQVKPRICVFVRRHVVQSTDASDGEKTLLLKLRAHYMVGKIFIVQDNSFESISLASTPWQSISQIDTVSQSMTMTADVSSTSSMNKINSGEVAAFTSMIVRSFATVEVAAEKRIAMARSTIDDIKISMITIMTAHKNDLYMQENEADQFYQLVQSERKRCTSDLLKDFPSDDDGDFEIKLPDATMFHQYPFLQKIVGEARREVAEVSELEIRQLYYQALISQTTNHAKVVAERFYGQIVMKVINATAKHLGIPTTCLVQTIDHWANNCKTDQVTTKLLAEDSDLCICARFLQKKHFTSAYTGGTVLSCSPILYGLVVPCLLDRKRQVNPDDYYKQLSVAVKYYDERDQQPIKCPT